MAQLTTLVCSPTPRAIRSAIEQVENPSAAMVFLPGNTNSSAFKSAFTDLPIPVAFTTTAGHFTEKGRCDAQAAVAVLGEVSVEGCFSDGLLEPKKSGHELAGAFSEWTKSAVRAEMPHSISLILLDSLAGTGLRVVDELRRATRPHQVIVGGAAGDNGLFKETTVGLSGNLSAQGAAVLHTFDKSKWGVGLGHGLRPATGKMLVTSAKDNVLKTIDDKPAFEAYRDFAKSRGVDLTPDNCGQFMIKNELGVFFFDELRFARAPLGVGEDGSLTLAAPIKPGSTICILDGDADAMLEAAWAAANEAKVALGSKPAAGVLIFDCICRGLLLADRFQEEIQVIQECFGDVPVAGFLTYGEIARYGGKMQGWHNTTAVVVAIPA